MIVKGPPDVQFQQSVAPGEGTHYMMVTTLIARFMGQAWGPSGADRTQVGPMLVPWTLLSGYMCSAISTPPPFFRSLENLSSFNPYIWAKVRKMSYFDPFFFNLAKCIVSTPFLVLCNISSQRSSPVQVTPNHYLHTHFSDHSSLRMWVQNHFVALLQQRNEYLVS